MDLTESLIALSQEIFFLYDELEKKCTILNRETAIAQGLEKFSPHFKPGFLEDLTQGKTRFEKGSTAVGIWPYTRQDGEVRVLEVREQVYTRHPDGTPWQILGTARDITETQALAAREQQMRTLILSLQEGLIQHDSSGAIIFANPSAETILGLTMDQMRGRTSLDPRWQAVREDGSPFPGTAHPAVVSLKTGLDQKNVIMGIRKTDGNMTWISINSQALKSQSRGTDGESVILGALVSFTDITHRKKDRLLKDLDQKMREYAGSHSLKELTRWFVDQGERITGSTIGFFQNLKKGREGQTSIWSTNTETHVCAVDPGENHHPVESAGLWAQAVREGKPIIHNDFTALTGHNPLPPGHPPLFRELLVPVWSDSQLVGLLGVGNKRTDYVDQDVQILETLCASYGKLIKDKQIQEQLIKMQAGLESSVIGYAFADLEGTITYVNPAFLRLWGYATTDEVYGRNAVSFWTDPDLAEEVSRTVRVKGFWKGELTSRGFEGTTKIMETWSQLIHDGNDRPVGLMATFSDVTESNKVRNDAQQLERLESLGTLAGGIAHDFNNLMGGIYGCIDMAMVTQDLEQQKNYLHQALNTMGRAKDLTRQLLTFAKGGDPRRTEADLGNLVTSVVEFTLAETGIVPEFHLESPRFPCLVDEPLMTQVIRNLTMNAVQAMPEGGSLKIRMKNDFSGGNVILILEMEDSGEGIPPENLGKIFDPFFTTRASGSGLGLSTCYSIVHKHGGTIEVSSELGHGTMVRIILPEISKPLPEEPRTDPLPKAGRGKILILDDEPMLLQVCGAMVRELGYEPHCVSTCREALDLWKQSLTQGDPFHGGILDLTLPGEAGGVDTARQIRAISPQALLFVSSGYSGDPVLAHPEGYGFSASLHKPFTLAELANVLRTTIRP